MTDPHDLDELASAHLDGTTTPEEAARLAGDPDLRASIEARADELRAVRDAVAAVPPVDAVRRDAAIAAALAAFDEVEAPISTGATVTPIAPRRGLSPRAVRALGAAAVVLLLALLIPLLANRGDDDQASFEATGDALSTTASGGVGGQSQGNEELAPSNSQLDTGGAAASPDQTYLGAFDDLDALAAAVASGEADPTATQRSADTAADDGVLCVPLTSSTSRAWVAVVRGVVVEVHVDIAGDGTRTMTVLQRDTCDQVDRREL